MLKGLRTKMLIFAVGTSLIATGLFGIAPVPVRAFTVSDASTAFNSFNSAFYSVSNGNGYYKADTNGGQADFWKEAEMMEMVIDAYERTNNSIYKGMIGELYNGFVSRFGSDWMSNTYNDDIMWMVIFCARAYHATGNSTYKEQAKYHFDQVYSRAWDSSLGGGLWWTSGKNEKNTCINAPAAIAAYLIYGITNDTGYLTKSQSIYAWVKNNLYNSSTGAVYDNINKSGTVNQATYTYNAGTFIGAADYLDDNTNAEKALNYARNNLTTGGILKSEGSGGDGGGFKGIFCRWAYKYVKDNGLGATYDSWFRQNADAAWNNRNGSNLMGENWSGASGSYQYSFDCSSAVVLMQTCHAEDEIVNRNAFSQIEAEACDSKSGMLVESCGEGGQQLGGIQNGNYAVYDNVDFGSGVSGFQARVAVDASAGGTIEIRTGSAAGTLLGSCMVSNTGGWTSYSTVSCIVNNTTGVKKLYLVFKTATGKAYVCNLNWFKFVSPQVTFYQDVNYGGTAKSVGKGTYDYNAMINAGIPNDWMSSLKVPGGWTVEVYQHGDFSGTKWTFTSDTSWVGAGCDNQMSAFKIY